MQQILLIGGAQREVRLIADALAKSGCAFACAAGDADALRLLRRQTFDVVITNPETTVEEDLALLEEMRMIRPGVKAIILAPSSAPEDVIAALRARVFVCFTAPFEPAGIAEIASRAAEETDWRGGIEVLSARCGWVSLRMNCRMLNAERLVTFLGEMRSDLPESDHAALMLAFREILMNAMEHGAKFDPGKVVEVAAVRTARAIVFYVRDPGTGFHPESLRHAAISNPPEDPTAHMERREAQGMRPGGYGILVARNVVDEMMYSEVGNEVLLIKHVA